MASNFKTYKNNFLIVSCLFLSLQMFGQAETSKWKLLFSAGVNKPIGNDQSEGYTFKNVNLATINIGVQHMFTQKLGAKLDYGYNRASGDGNTTEFKLNYSRVNAQFVYDVSQDLGFLPPYMGSVFHVGPGLTFSKPLNDFSENTYTYLNAVAGLEFHYGIAKGVSIYSDVSYILGLSGAEKYDPQIDGFSFNGDMVTLTIGVAVSLSGCRYCN